MTGKKSSNVVNVLKKFLAQGIKKRGFNQQRKSRRLKIYRELETLPCSQTYLDVFDEHEVLLQFPLDSITTQSPLDDPLFHFS